MSPVLVTGGSGYVGTQLIAALLRDGTAVRTTVRSLDREAGLREAVRRGGADDAGLEVVVADLTADDGWPGAVAGCAGIYHVASPMIQPKDPDELIVPARDGTLRVLRAARAAGARRVVLTSSFAAVGYTPKPSADYTEADWTDPDTPGLHPYPRAKAIAERAAWDFIEHEGAGTELVVVNPTFILGPTLTTEARSSLQMIKAMLDGKMSVVPRQRFGVADVRDVADLHIRAMATPEAAHSQSGYRPRKRREMSCPIWSSTMTAPATSSAGDRVPPKPRSWKPLKACEASDFWISTNDPGPGRNRSDHRPNKRPRKGTRAGAREPQRTRTRTVSIRRPPSRHR